MGKISPWLLSPAGWLVGKGIETYKNQDSGDDVVEAVKESEMERVQQLIQSGRQQGLSELSIKISSSLSKKLSSNAGGTVEAIPVNVAFDIGSDSNGDYTMHVKYLPKNTMEKFEELKTLFDKGILTNDEFSQAKAELLKQL